MDEDNIEFRFRGSIKPELSSVLRVSLQNYTPEHLPNAMPVVLLVIASCDK
jgi:hypothetical protein